MLQQSNVMEGGPAPGFRMGINHADFKANQPATAESPGKKQETDLLKCQFENKLLIQKLERMQGQINSTKDPNFKRLIPNSKDIDLNFNTKSSYVNILEKRIEVLTEALHAQKKDEALTKYRELEMQLFEEKADAKNLQKKYTKLKFKYHEIFKYKTLFDKTLTITRKMRTLFKAYDETGLINKLALKSLNLHSFDKVLDTNTNPYNETGEDQEDEQDDEVIQIPTGANEGVYKALLDKQNKIIIDMREKMAIKSTLEGRGTSSRMSKTDLVGFENKVNILKEANRNHIKELHENHQKELSALNAAITVLESAKIQFEKKMKEANHEFETRVNELNRRVTEKDLEVKEAQETVVFLKEKTKKLDEKIRKMMKDSQMQASKIMSSQIKMSSVSRDAISRSIMNMANAKSTDLQSPTKVPFEIGVTELKKIEEDLNKYEELGQNFEALKEINNSLDARNKKLEAEEQKLEEKVEGLEAEIRGMKTRVAKFELEENLAKEKIKSLEEELGKQTSIQDGLSQQIVSLKDELRSEQNQINLLRQNFAEKEQEIEMLNKESSEKLESVQRKQNQLNELKKQAEEAQTQMQRVVEENKASIEEINKLHIEVDNLNAKVEEYKDAKKMADALNAENVKLLNQIIAKENTIKETLDEVKSLRSQLVTLEKELKKKKEKFKGKIKEPGSNDGDTKESKADEQVMILNNLVHIKDEEINSLKSLLTATDGEKKVLEETNAALQKRFNLSMEEQQMYASKINEMARLKEVVEELRNGDNDIFKMKSEVSNLKLETKRLQETIAKLNQQIDAKNTEISTATKTVLTHALENSKYVELINELQIQLANLNTDTESLKEKNEDYTQMFEQLQKQIDIKEKEKSDLARRFEEFKNKAAEFMPSDEETHAGGVEVKFFQVEKERLVALLESRDKELASLRSTLKERECQLLKLELQSTNKQSGDDRVEELERVISEKEIQIVEMALFANKKSETIDQLNQQVQELTAQLKAVKIQSEKLEEQMRVQSESILFAEKKYTEELLAFREKHNISHSHRNTIHELIRVYQIADDFENELSYVKNAASDKIEQHPIVVKYKQQINDFKNQTKKNDESISELQKKLDILAADLISVRKEKRETEERVDTRVKDIEKLMVQIGELTETKAQYEKHFQNFKTEIKEANKRIEEKTIELALTEDKRNRFKIEINNLVTDKKLLNDKIDALHESIKEKDRQVEKMRADYQEVEENFINATEEFLQRIDEEKERNVKFEEKLRHTENNVQGSTSTNEQLNITIQKLKEENQKLIGKVNTLNDTVSLYKRTSKFPEEGTEEINKLIEYEKLISKLEAEKAMIQKDQSVFHGQVNELNDRVNAADSENEALRKKIAGLEEEIQALERRIKTMTDENEDYEQMILELRTSANRTSAVRPQTSAEVLVLQEKVKQYEKIVDGFKTRIDELEENQAVQKNNNENNERDEKRRELSEIIKKKKEKVQSLKSTIEAKDEEIRKLKSEITVFQKQTHWWNVQLEDLQNELEDRSKRISELDKKSHNLEELMKAETFASNKFQGLIAMKDLEIGKLKKDLEAIEDLTKNQQRLERDLKLAQQELNQKDLDIESSSKQVRTLQAKLDAQIKKVEIYQQLIQKLQQGNDADAIQVKQEIEVLRHNLQQTVDISHNLEKRLSQVADEKLFISQQMTGQIRQAEFQSTTTKEQLKVAQAEINALKNDNSELQNQINSMKNELEKEGKN
jgi:chromosome segregation ATPase